MSVVALPSRVDAPRQRPPASDRRPPAHRAGAPRRNAVRSVWRSATGTRRAGVIVFVAVAICLGGSMLEANRQVQLQQLQSQLLQVQSSYAQQVGSLANASAPGQIARRAGALRLVDPQTIVQVPSTPLDVPLPLPQFSGYAPATSRTLR